MTAPKLPEGLEPLPPDLEALMPEPVILRTLHSDRYPEAPYLVHGFTADQVRAAILGATERAANLAEAEAVEETGLGDHVYNLAIKHCAAAIRAASTSQEKEGAKGS